MIQRAPKKDPPATKPRPDSKDELLQEGLEESFPASEAPTAARRRRHQNDQWPVWDQYPETD